MAEALKGIYNRRHPERTDYYRIIEGSFEDFQRSYPDQFEGKYGYLRTEVMKAVYSLVIAEIFRARLLTVLLHQGIITQELINMLMHWNHHFSLRSMQALPGFNVHVRGQINGADGDAIENIARYMSRAAISVDRVEFNPADNTLTVYERKDRPFSGMHRTYTIMEFMALLAAHIPSPYESLVYY